MNSEQTYKEFLKLKIFKHISHVATNENIEAYVIGGFVRDSFLKRINNKDIDIVVKGNGIEFARKLANFLGIKKISTFKTYGTAMLRFDDYDIEFVGARKESYSHDSRNPVVENGSIKDDQNRRDFTINALALSLNKDNFGELIDPFNGMEDLYFRTIKTPLNPDITFSDDPLRMMRAVRFATTLDFEIEKKTADAIKKNSIWLQAISKERIRDELLKIIMSERASQGIELLRKMKLLRYIIPEIEEGYKVGQNKHHIYDCYEHYLRSLIPLFTIMK